MESTREFRQGVLVNADDVDFDKAVEAAVWRGLDVEKFSFSGTDTAGTNNEHFFD